MEGEIWHEVYGKPVLDWKKIPFPFFNNPQEKLIVEVGFGGGEFLIYLLENYSDYKVIGIDISKVSLEKTLKKLKRTPFVSRTFLVHLDAKSAIKNLFSNDTLDLVFSNFPDPWPKKKHQKRRIFDKPFLEVILTKLKTNGLLQIITDDYDYFHWVKDIMEEIEFGEINYKEMEEFPYTKYGIKWRNAGKKIYRLIGKKINTPLYNFKPIEKIGLMPNVVFETGQVEKIKEIKPLEIKAPFFIKISSPFISPDEKEFLFDVYLNEDGLEQSYFLKLKLRNDGKAVLEVYNLKNVCLTKGVKTSVEALAKYLEKFDFKIIHKTTGI